MRFSAVVIIGAALSIAMFSAMNAPARSDAASATVPRDYSFTISATQPWTDTGVDLESGVLLDVTASARSTNGCDPRGASTSEEGATTRPISAAPVGALIAKLQEQGEAVLVGNGHQLKVNQPGHLFFGSNGAASACNGAFTVKVHLTHPANTTAMGNALTTSSTAPSSASTNGAQSLDSTKTAPAQDIKSKLTSAAQLFLAGQFGTAATPASSSSEPLSNGAVSASPAGTAANAAPALSLSTAALDPDLKKDIDGLPRRVNDQFNNQGDMVNFVLIGSQEQIQTALEAANWRVADIDNKAAIMKAVLETYEKQDYLQMPMSQLYLFGRKQDFGYELAAAYSVVASRHHFRIWKAPTAWNGQTIWAGAGTHDIGFEKDQRNGSVTHKIDPVVDGERDNIGQTLQQSGKVKSLSYYLPPDPVQGAKNATGGGYRSDGRILVIVLQ